MFEKKLFMLEMRVSWSGVGDGAKKNIIVCPTRTRVGVIIASDVYDTIAVIHKWNPIG